jgi:hypothetical protein
MNKSIEVILFDLGGVLVELGIAAHLVNDFDQLKHFLKAQGIIDKK